MLRLLGRARHLSGPIRPFGRLARNFSSCRSVSAGTLHRCPHGDIGSMPSQSLPDYIFQDAKKQGSKAALVCGVSGKTVTYEQMPGSVRSVAARLAGMGVGAGDVVALQMLNSPEFVVAFHAITSLGATCSTVSSQFTAAEIAFQLKESGAGLFLTAPVFAEAAAAGADMAGLDSGKICVVGAGADADPVMDGMADWEAFDREAGAPIAVEGAVADPSTAVCALPFSSGTTGMPKGTMLTHLNIAANTAQIVEHPSHNLDMTAEDQVLGLLPFYHIYGLTVIVNAALRVGATVVTLPKFDPALFLGAIAKHQLSWLPLVPPIILFLAKHPAAAAADVSSVRVIFSGAAPLSGDLQVAAEARLEGGSVRQGWGATEISPVGTITSRESQKAGTTGQLVPNCTALVLGEDGAPLEGYGPDATGEIAITGPNMMTGYLGRPTDDPETFFTQDGESFWRTGDIGYFEEDGHMRIVDRAKELIKVKGMQVAPAELEGALLTHTEIADCAVVPIPDERAGELPKAFVVRAATDAGAALTEEAVKHFVDGIVADYKRIAEVEFVDEIPKSAAGKILRRVLRDRK